MRLIIITLASLLFMNSCEVTNSPKYRLQSPVDVLTVNAHGDRLVEYFIELARSAKGKLLTDLPKPPQQIRWEEQVLPFAFSRFNGRTPGGVTFSSEVMTCSTGKILCHLAIDRREPVEDVTLAINKINAEQGSTSRVLDVAVYFYPFAESYR